MEGEATDIDLTRINEWQPNRSRSLCEEKLHRILGQKQKMLSNDKRIGSCRKCDARRRKG